MRITTRTIAALGIAVLVVTATGCTFRKVAINLAAEIPDIYRAAREDYTRIKATLERQRITIKVHCLTEQIPVKICKGLEAAWEDFAWLDGNALAADGTAQDLYDATGKAQKIIQEQLELLEENPASNDGGGG